MNIIKRIGTNYKAFGTQLLNDENYATTGAIAKEFQNNAFEINFEVLVQWIQGKGRHPVTWKTLVEVLKDIDPELAKEIEICLH